MPDYTDGIIDVHYSTAANAADDISQQTQAIRQTLNSLEQELQALRRGWNGDDQAEYERVQQQWNNAVENMQRLLDQNRLLLTDVADGHRRDERSGAERWSSVRAG